MIVGMTWLREHNYLINWRTGRLEFTWCPLSCGGKNQTLKNLAYILDSTTHFNSPLEYLMVVSQCINSKDVRVVRPAYYLELQRISGGGCGGNFSIKGGAKVLKKINKSGCVTTVDLIAYIEKSVFDLFRKMTRNCIIENITVQCSCSRRSIAITNGVFSVDEGKN